MNQPGPKSSKRGWIIGILVVLCCIGLMIVAIGGYAFYYLSANNFFRTQAPNLSSNNDANTVSQAPTVPVSRPPVESISDETLNTLEQDVVPYNDPYDLACRLKNICNVSHTLPAPATPLQVGAQQQFWVSNVETDQNFQI
ncbi:MAG TPA: hypothetical protein VIN60_01210, partial [Anaerolineales bacterium]